MVVFECCVVLMSIVCRFFGNGLGVCGGVGGYIGCCYVFVYFVIVCLSDFSDVGFVMILLIFVFYVSCNLFGLVCVVIVRIGCMWLCLCSMWVNV